MDRYRGEPLGDGPRVAVIGNDAIGNFVVLTPLFQMLREELTPASLDYYGGTRVRELADASDLLDQTFPLHGTAPRDFLHVAADRRYDLVINVERGAWAQAAAAVLSDKGTKVCGPCLDPEGRGPWSHPGDERGKLWEDQAWLSPEITSTYPFLKSGHISEIFCRLAYRDGTVPRYALPSGDLGERFDVIFATAASEADKLWPVENWIAAARFLQDKGLSVALVGAKPADQGKYWKGASDEEELLRQTGIVDRRGAWRLPEVVGALHQARLVLTLDNGVLHMAASGPAQIVGLFRNGYPRLWAPRLPTLYAVESPLGEPVTAISWSEIESDLKNLQII